MTTRTSQTFAQRTGQNLGRAWRWVRDQQHRLVDWATAKGVPATLARLTVTAINLIVLAALLYVAFWVVLVVGLVVVLLVGALNGPSRKSSEDEDIYKWELRSGDQGFGVYSKDGHLLIGDDEEN